MKRLQLQIPKPIEEIITTLNKHHEVYFVGGCVRDLLLSKEIHDYDCTTSATVDEMKKILSNFKIIETGIKHGTLTIMNQNHSIEITTYRIEQEYINHRTPSSVTFTRNIHEDLKRRDFTVNALACDIYGDILDDHDGIQDLENKIIRCVGNPIERFTEDALRILRAIRFSCTLNFEIEKDTKDAIYQCLPLLDKISVERKFEELSKILLSNQNVYETLKEYQLFDVFSLNDFPSLKVELDQSIKNLDIRLACLFNDPLVARKIMKQWHCPNKQILTVSILVNYKNIVFKNESYYIRKCIYDYGIECTKTILLFKHIDLTLYNQIILNKDYLTNLAINGNDCIELGYQGKDIQIVLNKCIDYALHDLSRNNKEELIKLAKVSFSIKK